MFLFVRCILIYCCKILQSFFLLLRLRVTQNVLHYPFLFFCLPFSTPFLDRLAKDFCFCSLSCCSKYVRSFSMSCKFLLKCQKLWHFNKNYGFFSLRNKMGALNKQNSFKTGLKGKVYSKQD